MSLISKMAALAIAAAVCGAAWGDDPNSMTPEAKEFWARQMTQANAMANADPRVRALPKDYPALVQKIAEARGLDAKLFFEDIPNPLAQEPDKFKKELKISADEFERPSKMRAVMITGNWTALFALNWVNWDPTILIVMDGERYQDPSVETEVAAAPVAPPPPEKKTAATPPAGNPAAQPKPAGRAENAPANSAPANESDMQYLPFVPVTKGNAPAATKPADATPVTIKLAEPKPDAEPSVQGSVATGVKATETKTKSYRYFRAEISGQILSMGPVLVRRGSWAMGTILSADAVMITENSKVFHFGTEHDFVIAGSPLIKTGDTNMTTKGVPVLSNDVPSASFVRDAARIPKLEKLSPHPMPEKYSDLAKLITELKGKDVADIGKPVDNVIAKLTAEEVEALKKRGVDAAALKQLKSVMIFGKHPEREVYINRDPNVLLLIAGRFESPSDIYSLGPVVIGDYAQVNGKLIAAREVFTSPSTWLRSETTGSPLILSTGQFANATLIGPNIMHGDYAFKTWSEGDERWPSVKTLTPKDGDNK